MTEQLKKFQTRDISLFVMQWWQESNSVDFNREFGTGYADMPVYSDGLTLVWFRLESDIAKLTRAIFEQKYKQEANYYVDHREKYLADTAESRRILKQLHNSPLSPEVIRVLHQRFSLIFPMLRLCNFMPSLWEKETRQALGEKAGEVIALALRDRAQTEGVAELIDSLLRRMVRDKLAEIGKPQILAKFLTKTDLVALAEDKEVNWEEVQARSGGYVFCNGKIYPGQDWRTVFNQHGYVYEEGIPTGIEVKGTVAVQGGVVQGKVRIMYALEQLGEFQEGEVMVTPMTMPDFIPAMKKAVAVVTEEGGITCHAAIVCRELKKPCVIGTKVATKILKTGDVVEVDAVNGTVRKL